MGNQRTIENLRFSPLDIWGFQQAAPIDYGLLYLSPSTATNDNAKVIGLGSNATDGTLFTASTINSDGTNDIVTASPNGNLSYIETWIKPATTTEAICDFGAGKEVEILAGVVTLTGLGTAVVQVDRVTTTTMIAGKWQLLRIDLDSPVAVTEFALFDNNGTFGDFDCSEFKTNLFTWLLNESTGTLVYDSTLAAVNGTISGAVWVNGLSGLENGETHNGLPQKANEEYNIAAGVNIPAKSSDQTEDVLGNAIANPINVGGSQVAWNGYDGATGYLGSNYVLPIDQDTAFRLTMSDVIFFDLGTPVTLLSNRDAASSNRGFIFYRGSTNEINILQKGSGGTLWVKTTTEMSINTKYDFIFEWDGSNTIGGYTVTINTVEDTLITVTDTGTITSSLVTPQARIGIEPNDGIPFNGQIGIVKFELI